MFQRLCRVFAATVVVLLIFACGGGASSNAPDTAIRSGQRIEIVEMWSDQFSSHKTNGYRNGGELSADRMAGNVGNERKYILMGARSDNLAYFTVLLTVPSGTPDASVQLALVEGDELVPVGKLFLVASGPTALSIDLDNELPKRTNKSEHLDFRVLTGVDANGNQKLDLDTTEISTVSEWRFRVISNECYKAAAVRALAQNAVAWLKGQPGQSFHNVFHLGGQMPPEYQFASGMTTVLALDAKWQNVRAVYEDGARYIAPEGGNPPSGELYLPIWEVDEFSHRVGIDFSSSGAVRSFVIGSDVSTLDNPLIAKIASSVTFKHRIRNRLVRSISGPDLENLPKVVTKTLKVAERFVGTDGGLHTGFGTAYFDVALTAHLRCSQQGDVFISGVSLSGQLWDLYDFDFQADDDDPVLGVLGLPNRTAAILQAGYGTLGDWSSGGVFAIEVNLPSMSYPDSDFTDIVVGRCSAPDQKYYLIDIGDRVQPTAMNISGEVVGSIMINGAEHAVLYSKGKTVDLGTLGGNYAVARGINAAGQIVGESSLPGDSIAGGNLVTHAFLVEGGKMRDLGTLGGSLSKGLGINEGGQVVGFSSGPGDDKFHGFLYSGGHMSRLPIEGNSIIATAINDAGQIAGNRSFSQNKAFLYSGGVAHDIEPSSSSVSSAVAIDSRGRVLGTYNGGNPSGRRSFLYANGQSIDLGLGPPADAIAMNSLGDILVGTNCVYCSVLYTQGKVIDINTLIRQIDPTVVAAMAFAINDRGEIAGMLTRNGSFGGFLLTHVAPK